MRKIIVALLMGYISAGDSDALPMCTADLTDACQDDTENNFMCATNCGSSSSNSDTSDDTASTSNDS